MNIFELDSYNLADAVKFNDKLNPRIWTGTKMRPEVRAKLLEIAEDFKEFLGLSDLNIKDITVSGSNASYSYTPHSDIDLHLVVDIPRADTDDVYRELFDAKKYQYNDIHNIKIGGYDVELYVENANQPPVSKGVFSLLNNDWVNIPKKQRSTIDDDAVRSKYEDLKHRIDQAVESNDAELISQLTRKIKTMRQAGLDKHGELGPENLAYKMLRTQGYLQKIHDAKAKARDEELSLKERRKRPGSVFTYGFKHPAEESAIPEILPEVEEEKPTISDEDILKDFIDFCFKELKLKHMPTIKLRRDPQWSVRNKTFGRYIDDQHLLEVAWGNRHIMDVLRTVAHELTHKRQHEREDVPASAGETGSEYENEANARAGILMRDYARLHPEYFEAGQAEALKDPVQESASGYIPTKKQAKDPRWSMALTKDIKPGQVGKEANKLGLETDKQGHPELLIKGLKNALREFKETGNLPKAKSRFGYTPLTQKPGEIEDDLGNQEATGPEFPPQMPAGTTKVDVSDLTDWYQLGMDISDMDDADPADYNQGPPQTVLVFPSDEAEQAYLKQLKRLGLKTHDMDPDVPGGEDVYGKHLHEDEQLDEVKMSPSSLQKFASSPEAQGIQAGFEAELIFTGLGESDEGDYEPDYEADERVYSIQDVIDFFSDDSYGYGLSSRGAERLREKLDETYYEWYDNQMYADWQDNQDEPIRDLWLEEQPWAERVHAYLVDGMEIDDDEADRIFELGEAHKNGQIKGSEMTEEQLDMLTTYKEAARGADDILDEEVQNSIDKQDDIYDRAYEEYRDSYEVDDSDFFSDIGIRWMSDVAEEYNLDWPIMSSTGGEGGFSEYNAEMLADSLSKELGVKVVASGGYHSASRKPGVWIIEPDSSLDADDSDNMPAEIVSPPMPLDECLEKMQQFFTWAESNGAYANSSTGFHMGVSLPFRGGSVDYTKLALFLGDEYVLREFGRSANTYTASAMKKIRQAIESGRAKPADALELMKNNLLELAHRAVSGAGNEGYGKYTSINPKGNYIEFRSAGGTNYFEDIDKLKNTLLRYAQAMSIAGDPVAERKEYYKKLYKLISPKEGDPAIDLFARYAAGELSAEELKSQWAEKTLEKERASSKNANKWRVFRKDNNETLEVVDAPNRGEAIDQAYDKYGMVSFGVEPYDGQDEQEWEAYDPDTGEVLGTTRNFSLTNATNYFRDELKLDNFKVREKEPKAVSPRAKLAKRIKDAPPEQPQVWQVVNKRTGEVYDAGVRGTKSSLGKVLRNFEKEQGIPQGDAVLRLAPNQPKTDAEELSDIHKELGISGKPQQPANWEFIRAETGNRIDTVSNATQDQAEAVRRDIVRRYGHPDTSVVMRKVEQQQPAQSTNPNPTIQDPQQVRMPNGVPVWQVYERDSGNVVHEFADHTQREAWAQAQQWLRDIGAEDASLFSVRAKMLQPGERNLAEQLVNFESYLDSIIEEDKKQNPAINYSLWTAPVQIKQPNYVGRIDVTVTAPNAQMARQLMKAQYGVEFWQIGSVKKVK